MRRKTGTMKKVWHNKDYRLKGDNNAWLIDVAEWRNPNGSGELRVYRISGDINDKAGFDKAIFQLAKSRGLELVVEG